MVCVVCGDTYHVTRRRYESGKAYVCRKNGCHRFHCERGGASETPAAARKTESIAVMGVAGMRYKLGRGKRRHDLAPLANGRVKRDTYTPCVGGVSADE